MCDKERDLSHVTGRVELPRVDDLSGRRVKFMTSTSDIDHFIRCLDPFQWSLEHYRLFVSFSFGTHILTHNHLEQCEYCTRLTTIRNISWPSLHHKSQRLSAVEQPDSPKLSMEEPHSRLALRRFVIPGTS